METLIFFSPQSVFTFKTPPESKQKEGYYNIKAKAPILLVNSIKQASVFLVRMCDPNRAKYRPLTARWASEGEDQHVMSINRIIWDCFQSWYRQSFSS